MIKCIIVLMCIITISLTSEYCEDRYDACNDYDQAYCTADNHMQWMEENCNKFCGFCSTSDTDNRADKVTPRRTQTKTGLRLKIFTVESRRNIKNDDFIRFMRSAVTYGLDIETLDGGMNGPGDSHKIKTLRQGLKQYKNDKNLLIMVTDSHALFTDDQNEMIQKFKESDANVLFSSEELCWPDEYLAIDYPPIDYGYRYLNAGGFIGYAPSVYKLLNLKELDYGDPQLYFTNAYLVYKEIYNIKLDNDANFFQTLNGNEDDVELYFDDIDTKVRNHRFDTLPVVIHGNGPSKDYLNHLGNYISHSWSFAEGCTACKENAYLLKDIKKDLWPNVLIGLFISKETPFVQSFLDHISNIDYSKGKLDIFLHSIEHLHDVHVERWIKIHQHEYRSITYKGPKRFIDEVEGRNMGIAHCKKVKCDYYFSIDAAVTLSNRNSLQLLLEQNRNFLVPMVSKPGMMFSNFWGALGADGFYARSSDYIDIVNYVRRGVWIVPFVSSIYLIKASVIDQMVVDPFKSQEFDQDMAFSANARKVGIFMYLTNMNVHGHLKETESYIVRFKNNDMYQLFENRIDWEDRYLHHEFITNLHLEPKKDSQAHQNILWYPFVSTNFTKELLEEGAGGFFKAQRHNTKKNEVGFQTYWINSLKKYVAKMVAHVYAFHSHIESNNFCCHIHNNWSISIASSSQCFNSAERASKSTWSW